MEQTIYTICAVGGGVLVLLQVVLQALGMFAETDFDAHGADMDGDLDTGGVDASGVDIDGDGHGEPAGHGNVFFGLLSFKALCAFAAIFGLVGLIMVDRSGDQLVRVGVAVMSGVAGMFVVAAMMRGLSRLQSSGTVRIANAVGKTGSCYLRIPGGNEGAGKVTIEIQDRSQQFEARTEGDEIATGKRIRVTGVDGASTLRVVEI